MRWILAAALVASAFAQAAIDFSYAGYGGGGMSAPHVAAVLAVRPSGGDDTAMLQAAIAQVSARPLGRDGFRGALLLRSGRYRVSGQVRIATSGVVLRGERGAVVVATGTGRRTLIEVGGEGVLPTSLILRVADEKVPAGATSFTVEEAGYGLRSGEIFITQLSTPEWIASLGMRGRPGNYAAMRLDWLPNSRNLIWDRRITAVEGRRVTLDAPITAALDRRMGGAQLSYVCCGALSKIGIEDLQLESEAAPGKPMDEEHSWIGVAIDAVSDAWARGVTARRFAGSAVRVGQRARRITIEACHSVDPVSEPAGYRRRSFLVEGQQVLVRGCTSERGMNDFATGLLAAGPNVFLDDEAQGSLGPSGTFESWAAGVLYERVRIRGAGLRLALDDTRAQGAGWTAANSVVWNCDAKPIEVKGPEGAENIARASAEPLYEAQLVRRTGKKLAPVWLPMTEDAEKIPLFRYTVPAPASALAGHRVEIRGGRFVVEGKALWGGAVNDGWWKGQANPAIAVDAGGVAITRFVPGRTGPGLTEDLEALAAKMERDGTPFYQSVPGLWYDRRRDEHSVVARTDANVWAPFYEMPWARSGRGRAFDGLSLFDLTKFNPWYFDRLRDFAAACAQHGLVLHHNLYNTHNLLEILPHWVDYSWRTANNVNDTGIRDTNEANNKVHVADQVYDVSNPKLRALHRAFIRHELEVLGGHGNVFLSLGAQFAGPLAFQEFFHDVAAEWERETHRTVRIELATSKAITDAILADPARARQVAVIDMRYWQYRPDGKLWAPPGGQNLAFRESIAADFGRTDDAPPATTPQAVYRQVREYHDRYPDKAIVAWHGGAGGAPVLMAGGAQALLRNPSGGHSQGRAVDRTPLDEFVQRRLADVLAEMQPRDGMADDPEQTWRLATADERAVLVYSLAGSSIRLRKTVAGSAIWFDPAAGTVLDASLTGGREYRKPSSAPWFLLLRAR